MWYWQWDVILQYLLFNNYVLLFKKLYNNTLELNLNKNAILIRLWYKNLIVK